MGIGAVDQILSKFGFGTSGPDSSTDDSPIRPFWTVDIEDDETCYSWLEQNLLIRMQDAQDRTEMQVRNRNFYAGIQSLALGKTGIPRDSEGRSLRNTQTSRVVANELYDLTEQWVSKMTRFPPAIAVIPNNNDNNDRVAAKVSKHFIDHLFYINDIDDVLEKMARHCRVFGESYVLIEWDEDKGDYHPDADSVKEGERVPLVDSKGKNVLDAEGKPLYIDHRQKVGDIKYSVKLPWDVFPTMRRAWCDVSDIFYRERCDRDELKARFPNSADAIDTAQTGIWEGNLYSEDLTGTNDIWVYTYYHAPHPQLDKGRKVVFIAGDTEDAGTILTNEDLGYQELPVCRLTNIDVPGELHGLSMFQNLLLLQVMKNNLLSLAYQNIALGSHLYWTVPQMGNVDLKKLRNSSSVIRYHGTIPPKIQTFKTVGQEVFTMMDVVTEKMNQLAAIHGVSRGDPPPGIDAGIALTFLEEQENQRANTDIKKHNALIKKLARLSLSIAGDRYDSSDGRTIRIVGGENEYDVKVLDTAKLGGPYDIRVQRTTALSESKAGRLSQLLAIESRKPGVISDEMFLDLVGLANDQKFFDISTVDVRAAEAEVERMLEGESVPEPTMEEGLITHWKIQAREMRSFKFKIDVGEKEQRLLRDHQLMTEGLMLEKMKQNPKFAQMLVELEGFPMVYDVPDGWNLMVEIQAASQAGPVEQQQGPAGAPPQTGDDLAASQLNGDPQTSMDPVPQAAPVPQGEPAQIPDALAHEKFARMPIEER